MAHLGEFKKEDLQRLLVSVYGNEGFDLYEEAVASGYTVEVLKLMLYSEGEAPYDAETIKNAIDAGDVNAFYCWWSCGADFGGYFDDSFYEDMDEDVLEEMPEEWSPEWEDWLVEHMFDGFTYEGELVICTDIDCVYEYEEEEG